MNQNKEYAHVSLSRLCGCNYKVEILRKGKSIILIDPQMKDRHYRIDAALFDTGQFQCRSSWAIRKWDERAEQITESEKNWMD